MSAPNEIWLLTWDVRNANEQTGAWAFASEDLAVTQVRLWLEQCGNYSAAEVDAEIAQLREDGWCHGPKNDDEYRVTSATIRTDFVR